MEEYILYVIRMNYRFFSLYYLSPEVLIGFWFLFIGLIFIFILFHFVFFRLNDRNDSYKDRKRKNLEKEQQKERIARLYPKEN